MPGPMATHTAEEHIVLGCLSGRFRGCAKAQQRNAHRFAIARKRAEDDQPPHLRSRARDRSLPSRRQRARTDARAGRETRPHRTQRRDASPPPVGIPPERARQATERWAGGASPHAPLEGETPRRDPKRDGSAVARGGQTNAAAPEARLEAAGNLTARWQPQSRAYSLRDCSSTAARSAAETVASSSSLMRVENGSASVLSATRSVTGKSPGP